MHDANETSLNRNDKKIFERLKDEEALRVLAEKERVLQETMARIAREREQAAEAARKAEAVREAEAARQYQNSYSHYNSGGHSGDSGGHSGGDGDGGCGGGD